MTQGERIAEIRKSLGLTLEKFGEKLGVQRSAVSKIEKGRVSLSEQMALAICREYNVNYDYLIYGDGEMFDNLPETIMDELCAQYDLDDLDRALIDIYITLPADFRKTVKDRIRNVVLKENENDISE